MNTRGRIIDAWMQHPTRSLLGHPMSDTLGLSPEGIELFLCANAEGVFALTRSTIEVAIRPAAGAG